jgi:hypothetical protein
MILVAGLAIAGLAGIAAAFYFSMHPGTSQVQTAAGPGRDRAGGFGASRSGSSRPSSPRTAGTTAAAKPVPEARTGRRADAERQADAGLPPDGGREDTPASWSWRRVSWRKAADVDEELWPAEAFDGVSDEQFWDDLATDKLLATTARAPRADSGPRRRPARADSGPRRRPAPADSGPRRRPAPADSGPPRQPAVDYPAPRPGPADPTAIQPAVQPVQAAAAPSPIATRPYPVMAQALPAETQPGRAARQPAEPRGLPGAEGAGAHEDPLTSPAYSLRAKGAVDGRSYQRSEPLRSAGYQAEPLRSDGYGPYPGHPYSQPMPSMGMPPYGGRYGYQHAVSPVGDPRRTNGTRGQGWPGGNGAGAGYWGARPAYPPANGYRGPHDSWGNGRR